MSVPSTIQFPFHTDRILSGDSKDLEKYLRELTFSLQRMYEDLAQGINGDIRANVLEPNRRWTPVLKDTGNAGTTFTYVHQIGWVYRQGLMVDSWFDVRWSSNSGAITGNMYVELPYQVAVTSEKPFVGVLQPSIFAYTAGTECVINAISDTYRCEVWNVGDGFTTANQDSKAAGQLIGHIRYIGQSDE
jgi:hypothetical protein